MVEDITGVAVIGLSGRFPNSQSIEQYWSNMSSGVDCTRPLTRDEIIQSGVPPELADDPSYIRRTATLNDIEFFDAEFFDYLPTEASLTDPQIRLFLECVQHALDDAGCDPDRYEGAIGVYAGVGLNNYLLKNLMRQPGTFESILDFNKIISNDKDFLSTQVNYKFNLTGPGLSIQTACSTSLVAIQVAYQSLLTYQCDIALAGGSHLRSPRAKGMLFRDGEIYAPDGLCRPFDKRASGTIFGEGAGVVVLKRIEDAIADRDQIYAVIRGAAINNDGSQKISYAAPSIKGQADVVAMAHLLADVCADDIGYVEAHGTGTKLGDPVEVRALTEAFRKSSDRKGYCALGSGKSMIGHLDVAAGVAGFIRATLALKNKVIPATLHYEEPNPELKLSETPFTISAKSRVWESDGRPRLAAVSSFGVGGTNAHAVLQEYPDTSATDTKNEFHVLSLSAKSQNALDDQCSQLANHLKKHPGLSIADVCHTLHVGRRQFGYRRAIVCSSIDDAVKQLSANSINTSVSGMAENSNQPIYFMFSGQGSQHLNMCRDLYQREMVFKECIDECATAVEDILGANLVELMFGDDSDSSKHDGMRQTCLAQPALYAVECGLAKLWAANGVFPNAMIGHSIGEFAAAHISGVFSLRDGARIVAMRGKLMQAMPLGAMLSLRNEAEDVEAVLEERDVSVVVINGPEMTVVGGAINEIQNLKAELDAEEIPNTLLHTSHAFHSPMMEAAVDPFVAELQKYNFNAPKIPFVSNVSGDWITSAQAIDPEYWGKHLRSPVQFARGINTLSKRSGLLIEVGPNQALNALCREQSESVSKCAVLPTARHPKQKVNDAAYFYRALGGAWANGADVDLNVVYESEERFKVSLPGYPFQKQEYWRDAGSVSLVDAEVDSGITIANQNKRSLDEGDKTLKTGDLVHECWESVLGCKVSSGDNFFALGGHSLLATQMLAAVQQKVQVTVPLKLLNTTNTLGEFIEAVEALLDSETPSNLDTPESVQAIERLEQVSWPLSPQQKRLWFFHELASEDPAYNLAQPIYFEGNLDLERLENAINYVLSIHEAFNTIFRTDERGVFGVRHDSSVTCTLTPVTGSSDEDREVSLARAIVQKNTIVRDFSSVTTEVNLFVLAEDRALLVLFVPHLLSDGLSFNTFYQQVHKAYDNLLNNKPVDTGFTAPYQYSDYVGWLAQFPDRDATNSIGFWQSYLSGVADLIQLPTTFSRPPELSSRGSSVFFSLSQESSDKIKRTCRDLNTTPFVFFLTNFYLLLWKYSGQSSIVVGAPFANRANEQIQSIIGFFVDMVPVRTDVAQDKTYGEFLESIKISVAKAMDQFNIGLDKIVEASGASRQKNAHPLFQVTFTYLSYMNNCLGGKDYSMRQMLVDRGVSEYDLSLYMWEDDGFTGSFEFASDLFSSEAVERLCDHFTYILEWGEQGPDQLLSSLRLLDEIDLQTITQINNTEQVPFLKQHSLDLFKSAAARNPAKLALRAKQGNLTYEELDKASDILALKLVNNGIAQGDFVGVYTERGLNTLVSLLAIFKSGAAYIPLDPGFPDDRLAFILENAGVGLVLTDSVNSGGQLLTNSTVTTLVLPEVPLVEAEADFRLPPLRYSYEDLAYVLYTSGSTGKPKGVPIRHDSLANFLLHTSKQPGIIESDHLLAITTTSFDISFLELLLPIINGATLTIADSQSVKDGDALIDLIEQEDISYLQATPVTWSLIIDAGWKGKEGLKMLSGGEALKPELASRLLDLGSELWNAYGPTECTIWSSYANIKSVDEPHIGKPMANTSYFILDECDQVCPPGVIGELCIAGVAQSPGYFKRPDLTEAAFTYVDLPIYGVTRLYRTGDLAQLLPTGNFRCLGRKDFQVKIHGYRIELGEIESLLASYDGIEEVCCSVFEQSASEKTLVAYYRSAKMIDVRKLRDALKLKLPAYMIPGAFVSLEVFPKTANQKIDRKKLPAPEFTGSTGLPQRAPEDDIEAVLLDLFAKNLGTGVSLDDDYFAVGGNSILAMSLIRELNYSFGASLKVGFIFQYPTVLEIAKQLRKGNCQIKSLVIPLNQSLNSSEIYFVCGIALYQPLAQLLSEEFTCYGVYVPEEEEFFDSQSHTMVLSIPSLAKLYVDAIRSQNPDGPYTIAGVSFGGILAFEIARQLKALGHVVNDLIVLDAILPRALKRDWGASSRLLLKKVKEEGLRYFIKKIRRRKAKSQDSQSQRDQRNLHLWRAINGPATSDYFLSSPKLDQRSIIIRASDRSEIGGFTLNYDLGWGDILTGASTYATSDGTHLGIINSQKTADIILSYTKADISESHS